MIQAPIKDSEVKRRRAACRDLVWKRDQGICQICFVDTKIEALQLVNFQASWYNAKVAYYACSGRIHSVTPTSKQLARLKEFGDRVRLDASQYPHLFTWDPVGHGALRIEPKLWGFPRLARKHGHEIDHIIPFSQGGESIPENLRVLCIKCHLSQTRKLARKRAYLNAKERGKARKLKNAQRKAKYNRAAR